MMKKKIVSADQSTKNRRGIFIAIIVSVVLLSASYFVYQYTVNNPNFSLPWTRSQPLNVVPKLGSDTVTLTVSAKGGELTLADETTITFPAKSIMDNQVVTATKLESIGNLPTGYQLVSGIELTPATELYATAKILLPLPTGTDTAQLVGFEYTEGGTDFFLTPLKIVGQTAELTINGFSGHGVINIGDSSQLPPAPSTIEKQTQQSLSSIGRGQEELTSDDLSVIKNLLTVWFDTSVKTTLEKAAGADDASVDGAVHEFVSWLSLVQFYGLDNELISQENKGYTLAATALKSASDKAYARCVSDKDPAAAARLLRWYVLTELMGLDGKNGLTAQMIREHAKQCVNFELKITSEFNNSVGQKYTATGSVALSIDDDLVISGEGRIEQTLYKFDDNTQVCTPSAPVIFPIKVPGVIFDASADAGVSVYFEIGEPENGDPDYFCPFGEEDERLTLHGLWFTWITAFDEAHAGEFIGDYGYLIKDFDVLGSGGTYAQKTYNGSVGDQREHTTFELLHQPK